VATNKLQPLTQFSEYTQSYNITKDNIKQVNKYEMDNFKTSIKTLEPKHSPAIKRLASIEKLKEKQKRNNLYTNDTSKSKDFIIRTQTGSLSR